MNTALEEGAEVYLSPVNDPKRKTKFTWEMIRINGDWVGINTNIPNKLAYEMISAGEIEGLQGYDLIKPEVKFADSRFDIYAENMKERCFVEVKNVSMKDGDYAVFPDAVTTRGKKHLQTLMQVKEQGMRAVMLYVIQRMDVDRFAPAWQIDNAYAQTLLQAVDHGVEVIPLQVKVGPEGVFKHKILKFVKKP
jgi:sugar fermentation stimulation protein A